MSYVRAEPEFLGNAAKDLAGIGSTIASSNAMVAAPTVAVPAAAGDQVSAAVASFFSGHAQGYQSISAQAADFHSRFVQALNADAETYAAAEAANAASLQQPSSAVEGPATAPAAPAPIGNGEIRTPALAAGVAAGAKPASQDRTASKSGGGTAAMSGTAAGTAAGNRGGSSSSERSAPTVSGGGGGLLLGPSVAGRAGINWSSTVGGGAGGLLSRLGGSGSTDGKVTRVSGGIGVGVLLANAGGAGTPTPHETGSTNGPGCARASGRQARPTHTSTRFPAPS